MQGLDLKIQQEQNIQNPAFKTSLEQPDFTDSGGEVIDLEHDVDSQQQQTGELEQTTTMDGVEGDETVELEGEHDHLDLPFQKELGETVIELKDIQKYYSLPGRKETVHALKSITLSDDDEEFYGVKRGEFVMLRGNSGCGKTTLLNLIGTLDNPSGGKLKILGKPITKKSKDNYLSDLRLRRIGFVFQTFNLIATMSAYENVELPMTLLGKLSAKKRRQRAKELLTLVGLEDRMGHLPSELSGGEQQRVTIARALANDPEILIADEPCANLDTVNTVDIMDLMLRINLKKKTTCIVVTHNEDLECYADRILFIKDGKIDYQALNSIQTPLIYEHYEKFLKSR